LTEEDVGPLLASIEMIVARGAAQDIQRLREVIHRITEVSLPETLLDLDRALRDIGPDSTPEEMERLAAQAAAHLATLMRVANLDKTTTQIQDPSLRLLVESSLWGLYNDQQLAVLDRVRSLFRASGGGRPDIVSTRGPLHEQRLGEVDRR
jgi:hypothetical protein